MIRFGCKLRNPGVDAINVSSMMQGADFVMDQDAVETLSEAVAKCTALAFFPAACNFPIAVTLNDGSSVEVSKETALACLMTHNSNVRHCPTMRMC